MRTVFATLSSDATLGKSYTIGIIRKCSSHRYCQHRISGSLMLTAQRECARGGGVGVSVSAGCGQEEGRVTPSDFGCTRTFIAHTQTVREMNMYAAAAGVMCQNIASRNERPTYIVLRLSSASLTSTSAGRRRIDSSAAERRHLGAFFLTRRCGTWAGMVGVRGRVGRGPNNGTQWVVRKHGTF